jgi:hypothetical protein
MNDYPNTRKKEGKREWDCSQIYNAESRDAGTVLRDYAAHVRRRPDRQRGKSRCRQRTLCVADDFAREVGTAFENPTSFTQPQRIRLSSSSILHGEQRQ